MSEEWKVKTVGRRHFPPHPSTQEIDNWLRTVAALRDGLGVCPRGVFRFRTFEEAEEWKIRQLAKIVREHRRCRT